MLDTTVYELAWTLAIPFACYKSKSLARLDFVCLRSDVSPSVNLRYDRCVALLKYFALLATFDWDVRSQFTTPLLAYASFLLAGVLAWRDDKALDNVPLLAEICGDVVGNASEPRCTVGDVVQCARSLWLAAQRCARLSRSDAEEHALERCYRAWLSQRLPERASHTLPLPLERLFERLHTMTDGDESSPSTTEYHREVDEDDEDDDTPAAANVYSTEGRNDTLVQKARTEAYMIASKSVRDRFGRQDKMIGSGTFGRVYALTGRKSSDDSDADDGPLAIKKFRLYNLDARAEGWALPVGVLREAALLRNTAHPNLARALHFALDRGLERASLVMPCYAGGDLSQYQVPRLHADAFLRQMLAATQYLHRHALVHRDIKPDNFVMDEERRTLHLVDFSLASRVDMVECDTCVDMYRQYQRHQQNADSEALSDHYATCYTTNVCTQPYRPPELLALTATNQVCSAYDGKAVDLWSLGCVLAEMCREPSRTRALFYTPTSQCQSTLKAIDNLLCDDERSEQFFEQVRCEAGSHVGDWCRRLLALDPKQRPVL